MRNAIITGVFSIMLVLIPNLVNSEPVIKIETQSQYLFVINFDTGSYGGDKLTLNGNGQSNVIYFSDRPNRTAGHMGIKNFESLWEKEGNIFQSDPPNATLSLFIDGKQVDTVMALSNPAVEGNSIIFEVDLIKGTPPKEFKTGGLFLDPVRVLVGMNSE